MPEKEELKTADLHLYENIKKIDKDARLLSEEIRGVKDELALQLGDRADHHNILTEMIITGGISYAFFKHGKDTIKEGLEKVTPEHFHKKAESHAYRATHTATQYLVPPGLLRTYQRIPPVLKSGTAALALGVAFYEHGAHLQHKYVGMYTKASVRFSDFKEKVANTFKP